MTFLGVVECEGGPLLLADAVIASRWSGAEGGDYERVCARFDANSRVEGFEMQVASGKAIVWEMCGAGTASVFRRATVGFTVVRVWPHDPVDSAAAISIAEEPIQSPSEIGNIFVDSGLLSISWAVEGSLRMIITEDSDVGRATGDTSIENSALILRAPKVSFRCLHDQVENPAGVGRRLHLVPK